MRTSAHEDSPLSVGLLSFAVDREHPKATRGTEETVLEILATEPDLDLLVCAGWTLYSRHELQTVLHRNINQRTVVIFETWVDDSGAQDHRGYAIRGSEVLIDATPQVFATSHEINGDHGRMVALLDEIEARRLNVAGKVVSWLICGEINVLKNTQSEGNRCDFRFADDARLMDRWRRVVAETDVFVNPTHTVMGNQGKLEKRRGYLSGDGRCFCSVSNVDIRGGDVGAARLRLGHKPVQYFWCDGASVEPVREVRTGRSILREFFCPSRS